MPTSELSSASWRRCARTPTSRPSEVAKLGERSRRSSMNLLNSALSAGAPVSLASGTAARKHEISATIDAAVAAPMRRRLLLSIIAGNPRVAGERLRPSRYVGKRRCSLAPHRSQRIDENYRCSRDAHGRNTGSARSQNKRAASCEAARIVKCGGFQAARTSEAGMIQATSLMGRRL